jgi:adenine-specific DNA-methyltransferase
MAKRINKATKTTTQKPIEQYEHKDKQRVNNPPVGLVDAHTDNGGYKKKIYQYDPHLDPHLQWAGKAEHTSFEVPTVSLHVHERIDPRRIIESVKKEKESSPQMSLFEEQKKPLREAIEFYKHRENWSNRLIAGDSLLVMNSLLEKEGMGGKVQMLFFDPPYGIKYGSNFMPFVNKRDVKDGNDSDLTAEPEMLKAFRDTWELGLHSYLTYLRDRILLSHELLTESGSMFLQISDDNLHHVRELMDEVFGAGNFVNLIIFSKTATGLQTTKNLSTRLDYILWYAKDFEKLKYNKLFTPKDPLKSGYDFIELPDGQIKKTSDLDGDIEGFIKNGAKLFTSSSITKPGPGSKFEYEYNGVKYNSGSRWWGTTKEGLDNVAASGRLINTGNTLRYKRYFTDFEVSEIDNLWLGFGGVMNADYVVQTNPEIIQRCMLMTTDVGDLTLDITCGSGTTAFVAEKFGRRWITCDTSRIALTIAKKRLMTSVFEFYKLSYPTEGVSSGFQHKTIQRLTFACLANNEPAKQEILLDQPLIDNSKIRVTGPFTVEAVPAPMAKSFDDFESSSEIESDSSVTRSGETLRQENWRQELLRAGVRAKGGNTIEFTRVEPLLGSKYLQAEAETKEDIPKRVVVCFGPEHAPLEQRMVELAIDEARTLKPKPDIILFCAFHFDPEARKDIEETNWPGMTLLEAQMNADLLTEDLKKKRSSNESFWLIGQPDVSVTHITSGEDSGKITVEVLGFDYYNPKSGSVDSGGKGDIAMWMLDHDYDGRSLLPSQVFFPMAGAKEGWATLAKNLKAEIDEDKIEVFNGTVSLPFKPGNNIAVKIIDARGIESLKIIRL